MFLSSSRSPSAFSSNIAPDMTKIEEKATDRFRTMFSATNQIPKEDEICKEKSTLRNIFKAKHLKNVRFLIPVRKYHEDYSGKRRKDSEERRRFDADRMRCLAVISVMIIPASFISRSWDSRRKKFNSHQRSTKVVIYYYYFSAPYAVQTESCNFIGCSRDPQFSLF